MIRIPLEVLANIAQVIGAFAVVTGFVFGWYQIRQFQTQQRNSIAADLSHTFYSRDLAHAVLLLYSLPDRIPAADLRARGSEYEEAAIVATTTFETMGLLVFRGIAPFDIVLELAGGMIVVTWRKLSVWNETVRVEQSQPSWAEWFEWLAIKAQTEKPKADAAHIRFKDWKP